DNPQAATLRYVGHARQQFVVAATIRAHHVRHQFDGLPIEPQLRNRWPQKRADKEHFAAILRAGEPEKSPGLADGYPMMRIALDHSGIRPALDAEHHRSAAAPRHGVGDGYRKTAATADDCQ